MSAICGFYNFNKKQASSDIGKAMMSGFDKYYSDYTDHIVHENIFFGSHFVIITDEAENEKLPFRDITSGLTITADAIIDNRNELKTELELTADECNRLSDSQFILMCYKKWGKECVDHLIGDFAFAIYDEKEDILFCAKDHMGKRSLYYYCTQDAFYFSTTIEPVLNIPNFEKKLNDEWIAYFLGYNHPFNDVYPDQTIYENIKQVLPANRITVDQKKVHIESYWSPLNLKKIIYSTDEEYEKNFIEILDQAVKCRLRTRRSVAIMMSGGLDSTSVGCLAARELANQGKHLLAYCAIPMLGYKNYLPKYSLPDESEYVRAMTEAFKNIDLFYMRSDGKNSVSNVDELLDDLEQPYKIIENLFWMNNIISEASKRNSKIVLTGQLGNYTISYGFLFDHLSTLLNDFRPFSFIKAIKKFAKCNGLSSKYILKCYIAAILPEFIKKSIFFFREKISLPPDPPLYNSILNPIIEGKYKIKDHLRHLPLIKPAILFDMNKSQQLSTNHRMLNHIGFFDTRLSLSHGVQLRDPTADKRVVEYCFRVPMEQYVKDSQERSLLRRSFKGIMPDRIRLNKIFRGRQSADWVQRLIPEWRNISAELEAMLKYDIVKHYIDEKQIRRILSRYRTALEIKPSEDFHSLILVYVFARFLKRVFSLK